MQLRVKPSAWITVSGLSPACTLSTARIRISCNVLWSRARASRRFMPSIVSYVYLLMNRLIGPTCQVIEKCAPGGIQIVDASVGRDGLADERLHRQRHPRIL